MLQMCLGQADVPGLTETAASDGLRVGAFNPGPLSVLRGESGGLLPLPRGLDRLVVGLRSDRELAGGVFGPGVRVSEPDRRDRSPDQSGCARQRSPEPSRLRGPLARSSWPWGQRACCDLPINHEYALQTLQEIPYSRWREYNPEDTVRFFALRLHEAGMIKSSPQQIIVQGTDWRFLNELKKELKG